MWGRRALERRGRETSGSLEQRKRPTMREDRRPHRPEPERLTARIGALRSRRSLALLLRRSLWRVERSGIPTLSAPTAGSGCGRLCPACPEGFVALETSTDRSVARTAHKTEKTQGLEE